MGVGMSHTTQVASCCALWQHRVVLVPLEARHPPEALPTHAVRSHPPHLRAQRGNHRKGCKMRHKTSKSWTERGPDPAHAQRVPFLTGVFSPPLDNPPTQTSNLSNLHYLRRACCTLWRASDRMRIQNVQIPEKSPSRAPPKMYHKRLHPLSPPLPPPPPPGKRPPVCDTVANPPPPPPRGTVLPPYTHTMEHRNCSGERNNKASNNVRQSECSCGAEEYRTCPRGRHGCAIRFHFRGGDSKCPAKEQGIQVAVPQHTDPQDNTVARNKTFVLTKSRCPPPPHPPTPGGGTKGEGGDKGVHRGGEGPLDRT